jgi:2-methylcitrate dehydratase
VHIRSLARAADILADPSKYDPRTKETADHSLPYVIAAAVADPEIEALFPELQRVIVKVVTTDGRELTKQIDYPKGDPRNPLTDQEIEEKFDALAEAVMSSERRQQLKDAVWNLENQDSITKLMKLSAADS